MKSTVGENIPTVSTHVTVQHGSGPQLELELELEWQNYMENLKNLANFISEL